MSAYELTKTILKDSSSLKAYYRFESGALTTDSKGSYTLTNNNTVGEIAGVYGGGADFGFGGTNTNKYFSRATNDVHTSTGVFSYGGWFKTSKTGVAQNIINFGSGVSNQATFIYVDTDNKVKTTLWGQAAISSAGTVTDGAWHFVVQVYDGTNTRLYLDGRHEVSAARSPNIGSTFYAIGTAGDSPANYLSGALDDIFVIDSALSADQIKELYEGRYIGEWMPQANLVGLWHLNGNSTDSSGNNNHGTDTAITYGSSSGKIGTKGGSWNGTSSMISIADSSSLRLSNGSFTIMWWHYQIDSPSVRGHQDLTFNKDPDGSKFGTEITTALKVKAVNPFASTSVTSNTTLSTGVWYHIAHVRGSGTYNIYINGNSDVSASGTNLDISATGTPWTVGGPNTWYPKIYMDEAVMFTRALTAAEIRHWYAWSMGRYL